jgi:amino acid transporter
MFQFLAFMSLGSGGASEAFEWLTNINSANTLIIWIVIGICSWRMRKAMKAQGISPERLPYKFPFQPILAQITIWGSSLILITGGFYVFVSLPIVTYDPEP